MKPQYLFAATLAASPLFISTPSFATTSETVHNFQAKSELSVLKNSDKRKYRAIYDAIQAQDWTEATKLIDRAKSGPMKSMARAELFLAAGSPRIEADDLAKLLNDAPWLPQAAQLERLAIKRGATGLPQRPAKQRLSFLGESPRRTVPAAVDAPGASAIRAKIKNFIRDDMPGEADAYLNEYGSSLSREALTEMQHRVAWSYYIENDDRNAQRLGQIAKNGSGLWAVQGSWAHGMASWRLKQYDQAFHSFDIVARRANNDDMRAAGLFWSARAAMAAGKPQAIQQRLQNAARLSETFYGLLASEQLGMEPIAKRQIETAKLDWKKLKRQENVTVAVGLTEIGESSLADESIKFQARIGDARQHGDLANLAGALNLPTTQLWLGHYGPSHQNGDALARYPKPNWKPAGGWRVDPSLAFAHSLQESQFRTSVVSPAGAKGLMQIMPGTAKHLNRNGVLASPSRLNDPATNLEFGQSYLEQLRDDPITGGLLPKVIAAYNAGPTPVARWNHEVRDNGDPLLYMESVPYWETRGYLTIILRNYWIYEMRSGKNGGSRSALSQYLWPRFPSADGISLAVSENGTKPKDNSFAHR